MSDPIQAWSDDVRNLTPDQAKLVSESKLLSVELEEPPNRWRLVTNSRIGIVQGDDWEIRVVPRIAIPKLMFLLSYAADSNGWQDSIAGFGEEEDLFSGVANGFSLLAQRALEPAPLRGYTEVDELSQAFRGRLRVADQMARTLPLPLEINYDDYTIDTQENRIILAATELLLRFPWIPERARRMLLRIRARLDGVQARLATLTEIPITRLNRKYGPALKLASLIMAGSSITTSYGKTKSTSFVFDMNRVFEDFLSVALTDALRRHGGRVATQYQGKHLDDERQIKLIPDITWWKDGKLRGLVDAKFKALTDSRFPNADAFQMLAYCFALSLPSGYLVYAHGGNERPGNHTVTSAGVKIKVRTVDVAKSPKELLERIDLLADEISADTPAMTNGSSKILGSGPSV